MTPHPCAVEVSNRNLFYVTLGLDLDRESVVVVRTIEGPGRLHESKWARTAGVRPDLSAGDHRCRGRVVAEAAR